MNKISTYRKQLGLSQRQLATHLGWIQSRLANYEANFRTVEVTHVQQVLVRCLNRKPTKRELIKI
ncbi:helix-turn-helix domain-containing protein [Salmonella enterica]|nr:helix-turn-helix transcriptional regulator [Salmonella enterica]ECT8714234.1 XRE family transcriptional regulator [Salmonella enterica subsp. enterica serovar Sandiego]EDX7999588.1 helix-turn-helix transcriptional regulator [Salmonella enterica subsp. enterica serovar Sandiego]